MHKPMYSEWRKARQVEVSEPQIAKYLLIGLVAYLIIVNLILEPVPPQFL